MLNLTEIEIPCFYLFSGRAPVYFHVSRDPVCLHFARAHYCGAQYIPCSAKLPGSTAPFYICTTLCFFLCRADVSWYLGTRAGAGGPRARHQSCISRSGRSCAPAKALPRSVTNAFLIAASLVQTQPLAALCLNHRLKPKV